MIKTGSRVHTDADILDEIKTKAEKKIICVLKQLCLSSNDSQHYDRTPAAANNAAAAAAAVFSSFSAGQKAPRKTKERKEKKNFSFLRGK